MVPKIRRNFLAFSRRSQLIGRARACVHAGVPVKIDLPGGLDRLKRTSMQNATRKTERWLQIVQSRAASHLLVGLYGTVSPTRVEIDLEFRKRNLHQLLDILKALLKDFVPSTMTIGTNTT